MLLAIKSTNSYNLSMLLILSFTFYSRETTLEILCYSRHTVWSNAELELALTSFDTQLPVDCVGSQECNSDYPLRKTEHLFYLLGQNSVISLQCWQAIWRLMCTWKTLLMRLTSLLNTHTDNSFLSEMKVTHTKLYSSTVPWRDEVKGNLQCMFCRIH